MGRNASGGVRDEHPAGERYSSKLQHRAPLKVPSVLVRTLATLGKPLNREFLFYPGQRLSTLVRQWPMCCAGASPTEVRCALHLQSHIDSIVDLS